MIDTQSFLARLVENGVTELAGVPCSFLGPLIDAAQQRGIYRPYVNEGDAVAYAAGAALCGRRCAVLMQNSGLTNALSPLSSLNELFGLHVLLLIGNRGAEDEPQHKIMAGALKPFLDALRIPYFDMETGEAALSAAFAALPLHSAALLVNSRDTFSRSEKTGATDVSLPLRHEILQAVAACAGDAVIVTATGFTSREMFCTGDRAENFYMVGSMGCLASLSAGIAGALPQKKVIAIDGDSACLMRLGGVYTLTQQKPDNLFYLVLDNGVNESTGGQPNACGASRLYEVLSAMHMTAKANSAHDVVWLLQNFLRAGGYTQMVAKIRSGTPEELRRPDRQLIFNQAQRFSAALKAGEET